MELDELDGPVEGDAFGQGLIQRFEVGSATVVIERDDGLIEVDGFDYFSPPAGPHWEWIRSHLGHRILDIGCGAGRASLALQELGRDVVGLDVSPGAVEVSSRRGVDQTFLGTVEDLAATNPAPFDSFVGLGNNLGLLADPARAITFLEVLGRMSHAGSNLVGTILDPYGTEDPLHLAYHEANRGAGRLAVTDPDTDLAGDARPRPGSDCSGAHRTSWPKWSARPDGSWLRSKVRASMPPSCGAMGELAMTEAAEEGTDLDLDFSKLDRVAGLGVLPCAVQDVATGEVILIAYVNAEALQAARSRRRAVFWSTSRNELWEKGATSGAAFELVEVRVNCEQNSLLYLVRPLQGGICHTRNQAGGARNCFYRCLDMATGQLRNMDP